MTLAQIYKDNMLQVDSKSKNKDFEGKQEHELPERRGKKILDEEYTWAKVEG